MPRNKKRYDAPPITEALYEVFVTPRADLSWNAETAHALRDAVDDGFVGREEQLQQTEMQVAFKRDQIEHGVRQAPPRFRWWHREEHRAIQTGANMCAHNVLPPYTEYERYVPSTERLFAIYLEHTRPTAIGWVGQRYINEIRVPLDRAPTEFFAIYPPVSERIGQTHPNLALQVETASFGTGNTVTNLVLRRADEEVAVYVLDIYARSSEPIEPSVGALMAWHDRAHATISHSFELSITDLARQAFKEVK